MKLHPIIMTAESVRATIDRRKTQMRLVITDAMARRGMGFPREMLIDLPRATVDPGFPDAEGVYRFGYLKVPFARPDDGWEKDPNDDTRMRCYAPWSPGDVLWVREAWELVQTADTFHARTESMYENALLPKVSGVPYGVDVPPGLRDATRRLRDRHGRREVGRHAMPSSHMPLWLAHIFLRVEAVRAERLQDITHADCFAEGHPTEWSRSPNQSVHMDAARDWFIDTWDSINAERGHSWASNPWVWVVSYSVLSTTGVDGLPDDVAAIVRAKVQQRKEDR